MENPEVAQVFEEVADLLELIGENPFRIRAYRTAARTIRDLGDPLERTCAKADFDLTALPGIGDDLAGKIHTILETSDLPLRQELRKQVPAGLRTLLDVPTLGPKRARKLYDALQIVTLDQLRQACTAHQVSRLKGFGEKTEGLILHNLEQLQKTARRCFWVEANVYAQALLHHLQSVPGVQQISVAGSHRRCKETVGDLDLLVACRSAGGVMDRLAEYTGVKTILAHGPKRMSVHLRIGLQVDLRVVSLRSFGAALQYFTGSKAHNIALRRRAQERGLKINEYGVFRNQRFIAGKTEEAVYAAVGLPWIPPELREDRGEIELAENHDLPRLIEPAEIHGDLHTHTDLTDGRATLEEMVDAAKQRGYEYIAITDHSQRVSMAKGLDARRLRQQWRTIDRLAKKYPTLHILRGVEVDILENGRLDLSDDILQDADWVVASLHYGLKQSSEQITRRLLNAIRNPAVDAIGHPTARLIGRRPPCSFDVEAVFREAAQWGCCMEANGQPSRLDLDDVLLIKARQMNVPISLGSDAHAVEELGFLQGSLHQARRAGLESKDVVNTREWNEFTQMRANRHVRSVAAV